jgi:hypothetical protein
MPALIALTERWVLRTATESEASSERNPNAETKTPRSEGDLGAHWGAPEGALGSKSLWGVQDSDLGSGQ